jgi:cell division protein FtsI (penicillin-binding protein 3)
MSIAFFAVLVVFGAFTVRVVALQGVVASDWAAAAKEVRAFSTTLPAERGAILDTNGVPLVASVDAVHIAVDPHQVTNAAAAALQLSGPLQRDPAVLQKRMTSDPDYVRLARNVDTPVWAQIQALGIPGIYSEPAAERAYPSGTVAGNVVGFVGGDDDRWTGMAGVEQAFDDTLAGTPGSIEYERDSAGRMIPLADQQRTDPVAGRDVELTIDRDLQWYTEQALAAKVREARAQSGSAVLMDARTQAVLAMASVPLVDPRPNAVLRGPERTQWNLAAEETYEPGSVQKVLTMAALVDSGAARPNEVFRVPDSIVRSTEVIGDFAPHPTYRLTLSGILAKSSNVGTLLAAERLSPQQLREYLVAFGYGSRVGLGLPGGAEGRMPNLDDWTPLQHDTIAFGQGISTSIMHLASAYATIANGGVREAPHVVTSVVDADGTERPVPRGEARRVISERSAAAVTRMMEAVVGPDGTASNVVVPGYRIAGKTGTAERVDPECACYRGYTATFAGFAPADDPRLVMVVSIQDPIAGRYGGQLGGPVFADVMSFALPRLGIPPSGAPAPNVRVWGD